MFTTLPSRLSSPVAAYLASTTRRASSSMKAYPQYSVFGEDCMLSLKMIMPVFRLLKNNSLVVDGNKKGRLLLEWTPRASDGTMARDRQIRFGLSPEEIGLILDQLPNHQVELTRKLPPPTSTYGMPGAVVDDEPDKVLRIAPMNGGVVSFYIDYEKEGSGGQIPSKSEDGGTGPLNVNVQLGEYTVMAELMRTSIPILVGWSTLVDVAMQRNLDDLQQPGGGRDGVPF